MRRVLRTRTFVAAVAIVAALGGALFSRVTAQDSQANLSASDAMRLTLNEQVGKRVKVKLSSGQEIEGQVARVGTHAVAMTQLTGQEFYNATIAMDEVAAVIIRAPGR